MQTTITIVKPLTFAGRNMGLTFNTENTSHISFCRVSYGVLIASILGKCDRIIYIISFPNRSGAARFGGCFPRNVGDVGPVYGWAFSTLCCRYTIFPGHQAPVPLTLFRSNSKFDQNVECSSLKYASPITTKFCTRHDSNTVVTCA